ncbi:MAG TPA: plasmid pRiA4b ORF-3 family protein [Candidatus Paceibacterota bacterium]
MYKYLLPNGTQIDAERICDAVLRQTEYPQQHFDTETGDLVEIVSKEHLGKWVHKIGKTRRYIYIEHFDASFRIDLARQFIKLMDTMEPDAAAAADAVLKKDELEAFEQLLEEKTDGWIHGWRNWLADSAWESVHEWLTHMPGVPITPVFEGFDDCAVCELTRKGKDRDPAKLADAFAIENTMQTFASQMKSGKKQKPAKSKNPYISHEGSKGFVFKITLSDSKPSIWRRIIVPANYTFFDLHCAIQDAMGWTDSHLHAFRLDTRSQPKGKRVAGSAKIISIELPNPEMDVFDAVESKDERNERIADWFPEIMKQCTYEYDFGDGWTHTVLFEKEVPLEKGEEYPQCVAGKNACPPDDCGGLGGYDRLQLILKDPKDEEHADMLEWLCIDSADEFDPLHFNPEEIEFMDPVERLKEYEKGFGW